MKRNVFFLSFFVSCLFSFCTVLVSTFVVPDTLQKTFLVASFKGLAMLVVVLFFLYSFLNNKNHYNKILIVAFAVSMIGDFLIAFNGIIGGAIFLLSLILFIVALFNYEKIEKKDVFKRLLKTFFVFIIFFTPYYLYFLFFLVPNGTQDTAGIKDLIPIYIFFQSLFVSATFFSNTPRLIKVAAISFFVSDVVVFYGTFFGYTPTSNFIGMLFYLSAQNIFAVTIKRNNISEVL